MSVNTSVIDLEIPQTQGCMGKFSNSDNASSAPSGTDANVADAANESTIDPQSSPSATSSWARVGRINRGPSELPDPQIPALLKDAGTAFVRGDVAGAYAALGKRSPTHPK